LYSGQLRCATVDLPPTTSFEALCTRFRAGNSAWLMLTVYRLGSCDATVTFFEELSAVLETLVTHGCPVIIGGDFNIHVENPSDACSPRLTELVSCRPMDLQQHVTSPTRQAGGTLDLVITFSDHRVDQLTGDPPGVVLDYSLITCSLPDCRILTSKLTRKVHSWRSVDRTIKLLLTG